MGVKYNNIITTRSYLKPVYAVKNDDFIKTLKYNYLIRCITKKKEHIVKIQTYINDLYCSYDQKIAIIDGLSSTWKFVDAGDIRLKDRMVFATIKTKGKYKPFYPKKVFQDKKMPVLNPNIAWFMGFTTGASREINNSIVISFKDGLRSYYKFLSVLRDIVPNAKPKLRKDDTIVLEDKWLIDWLYWFKCIFGYSKIHKDILVNDIFIRSAYISGIYDSHKKSFPYLFARRLQNLYMSLGLASYLFPHHQNPDMYVVLIPTNKCRLAYYEYIKRYIVREYIPQYSYNVSFSLPIGDKDRLYGSDLLNKRNDYVAWDIVEDKLGKTNVVPVEVKSIEDSKEADTFDIYSRVGYYICNGFIVKPADSI